VKTDTYFEPAAEALARRGSAAALIGFACVAILLLVYSDTAISMAAIWYRSETFAHGFLVAPISAWLVWRRRKELARIRARPFWPGVAVLGAAGILWLLSELAGVAVGAHLALVGMLQGAILTVLGVEMARAMAFPLAFLLFAVPAGEILVPTLIDWTADFTIAALRASAIPVYREGNRFAIPSGSWSVVEACSGIRYLIASLMAGTLFAYLTYRSALRRTVFIGAAIAVPIVANWLRAYLIVMLGHLSGNKIAAGVDHLVYGWFFFGVVILAMFWVGSLWREDPPPASPGSDFLGSGHRAASAASHRGALVLGALVAVIVAGAWRPIHAAIDAGIDERQPVLARIEGANGWIGAPAPVADWKPRYLGYRAELEQTFLKNGRSVGVYVAYYSNQSQGRELVNSQNLLVTDDDARWNQVAAGSDRIDWAGSSLAVRSAELSGRNARIEVLYWYWVDGRITASNQTAKLLLAWSKLADRDDGSAVVMVYAVKPEGGSARAALKAFARDMSSSVERVLAAAERGG
jgi:exosortase A